MEIQTATLDLIDKISTFSMKELIYLRNQVDKHVETKCSGEKNYIIRDVMQYGYVCSVNSYLLQTLPHCKTASFNFKVLVSSGSPEPRRMIDDYMLEPANETNQYHWVKILKIKPINFDYWYKDRSAPWPLFMMK